MYPEKAEILEFLINQERENFGAFENAVNLRKVIIPASVVQFAEKSCDRD